MVKSCTLQGTVTVDDSIKTIQILTGETNCPTTINKYAVTVTGGTGGGEYAVGATVTITATVPPGKQLVNWTSTPPVAFDNANNTMTTFPMIAEAVAVEAIFGDIPPNNHNINVTANGGNGGNGGGVANADVNTSPANQTITLTAQPGTGWNFVKWQSVSGGVTIADTTNDTATFTMPDNAVEVNAVFEAITYGITYTLECGSPSTANPATYTVTTPTFTLNNPARAGYDFTGWTGTDLSPTPQKTVTIPVGSTGHRGYTANCTLITYTITFDATGGTVNPTSGTTIEGGALASLPPTPTRSGYTFNGWFDAVIGGTAVGTNTVFPANATIYAQWTAIPYAIAYTLNGGSGVSDRNYTIEDLPIQLPAPTRTGYNFTGYTGSNGATPQTAVTIPVGSIGDKNYTANWTPTSYTITYDLDGGTNNTSNPETYTIETETITLQTPEKRCHIFIGWYDNVGFTGEAKNSIPTGSTGAMTYWAKWEYVPSCYIITFDPTGGTVSSTSGTTTAEGKLATLPVPSRNDDATFVGWYTVKGNHRSDAQVGENTTFDGDTTIYARWQYAEITDSRDGSKRYPTAVIGSQIWMAKNLDYEINEDITDNETRDLRSWCYGNSPENCDTYGRLYTWDAAMEACPAGWRLPRDDEWNALMIYANKDTLNPTRSSNDAGTNLSHVEYWGTNTYIDEHGFSALPGGQRLIESDHTEANGGFYGEKNNGFWWSATPGSSNNNAIFWRINDGRLRSGTSTTHEGRGYSVRCIKGVD